MDHRLTRLIAVASSSVLVLTILAAAPAAVRATTQIYIGDGTGSGDCAPGVLDFETDGSDDNLVFDDAADAAEGSLNNILYVCPGTYDITGDIDVSSDLTIVGVAGAALTILDSDGSDRILNADNDLVVIGLTFKDGVSSDGDGGAIYVGEDFSVEDSVFINNEADGNGGAIYVYNDLDLISNSVFTDNISGSEGGAVFVDDDLTDNWGDSRAGVIGSSFSGNKAADDGGAINIDDEVRSTVTITENDFSNNVANNDGMTDGEGGAIFLDDDFDGTMTNNTFTSNSARDGGAVLVDSIYGSVSGNKFSNNIATQHGGAIYSENMGDGSSITRNQFRKNQAEGNGGAMWLDDDWASDSLNVIVSGNSLRGNRAQGNGGGIFLYWNDATVVPKNVTRNSFRSNRAGGIGGGIAIMGLEGCAPELTTRQAARAFKKNKFASNRATESRRTKNVGAVPCVL